MLAAHTSGWDAFGEAPCRALGFVVRGAAARGAAPPLWISAIAWAKLSASVGKAPCPALGSITDSGLANARARRFNAIKIIYHTRECCDYFHF